MKVKEGFVTRKVAGKYVVVATGQASREFHGMVKLNETGKIVWEGLSAGKSEEELVSALVEKYGAESQEDRAAIAADVSAMIQEMADAGFLVE
ncbi:MAG: PqqD family protein [Oscillospiraceae bacterium]|nr:PqqD family protein [Oscillospiraceae bacterium]